MTLEKVKVEGFEVKAKPIVFKSDSFIKSEDRDQCSVGIKGREAYLSDPDDLGAPDANQKDPVKEIKSDKDSKSEEPAVIIVTEHKLKQEESKTANLEAEDVENNPEGFVNLTANRRLEEKAILEEAPTETIATEARCEYSGNPDETDNENSDDAQFELESAELETGESSEPTTTGSTDETLSFMNITYMYFNRTFYAKAEFTKKTFKDFSNPWKEDKGKYLGKTYLNMSSQL